ncbi:hypothetical protein CO049_02020 [Candidatus Roizmanbacteria bacterium CG_4_9_14_0_2_um_filter_36_12]|uniref:Uncharacterized protein n=1 Tax=Candidatus Roizmanbacteria bacterium CG_4_9_14_0_2_um_filter_36_12 TaxID=1974837 RepID=A0A2M8F0C8_9BACT|nr:MAG: hypothetical protein CO049_02020 [Candidatus Roizmanbacteria bacterium CG_4_9_14_0_2_um_filter_36_12]
MKCIYIKEGGEQCNAFAMGNSQFCYLHNPDITDEEKRINQTKGGKSNIIRVNGSLPLIRAKTSQEVAGLLEKTINEVRSGELDPRIANTIGYLAGHLIKAIEVGEVEKRINAIEEVINK